MIIGMEEPSSVDRVQDNLDRVFGLLVFCVILEAISVSWRLTLMRATADLRADELRQR
jgi:hypothetical protein